MPIQKMLSIKETAAILGISAITALRMVNSGYLPARKVGRQWRINPNALERFMDQRGPRSRKVLTGGVE